MNPMLRFASQLTINDLELFLTRYAGFVGCIMEERIQLKDTNEIFQYFFHNDKSYIFKYSDYYVWLKEVVDEDEYKVENLKFSGSDWLCFLKSKFGEEYLKHFAEQFHAEDILFENSKFLSRVSFDELVIVIKNMLKENPKNLFPFEIDDDIEIIEKESFFMTERRFLIEKKSTGRCFFIRLSDFQSIRPRLNPSYFIRFMAGKFGQEYLKEQQKNIFGISNTKK